MVHMQMDGRPMVAPTTMLVRKLFDKPEFTLPFSKFFESAENFFPKKFFASTPPSPVPLQKRFLFFKTPLTSYYHFDIIITEITQAVIQLNSKNDREYAEQQFLSDYSMDDYDRPAVATDIAAFSLRTQKVGTYRMSPELKLCVLLIKRSNHPFKDHWALPGGFLRRGESIDDCAFRELREKTNLTPVSMLFVDSFSAPDRDPRGWIISNAYASVIGEETSKTANVADGSDTGWFEISFSGDSDNSFLLELRHGDILLTARLAPEATATVRKRYKIIENCGLAFDHAAILAGAMALLKREGKYHDALFAFLPEKFTLSALQRVQETLLGTPLLAANFRRKIAEFVEETDEYTEGAGHRPARLFKRKALDNG
ncbi:MAG: NUDIX hydrolase [Ruminococcaceae bacterium]|nr:NUDIX hydrolase [Oscillospiraceae bacterium]